MTRIKRLRATHRKTRLLNHVHAVWQLVGRTIWRSVRGKHRAATFDCRAEARSDPTIADVLNEQCRPSVRQRAMYRTCGGDDD
jgi:hypothetical protein